MFTISGSQSLAIVEKNVRQLAVHPDALLLAGDIEHWRLGAEAALIQYLITWSQSSSALLRIYSDTREAALVHLRHLVRQPFGFVAITVAKNITSRNGRRAFTDLGEEVRDGRINTMFQDPLTIKFGGEPQVFLAGVD